MEDGIKKISENEAQNPDVSAPVPIPVRSSDNSNAYKKAAFSLKDISTNIMHGFGSMRDSIHASHEAKSPKYNDNNYKSMMEVAMARSPRLSSPMKDETQLQSYFNVLLFGSLIISFD